MRRFATILLLLLTTGCAGMYVASDTGANRGGVDTYSRAPP